MHNLLQILRRQLGKNKNKIKCSNCNLKKYCIKNKVNLFSDSFIFLNIS